MTNERTDKGVNYPRKAAEKPATGTKRTRAHHEPPSPGKAAPRPADMTATNIYGDNYEKLHSGYPKSLAESDMRADRTEEFERRKEERARLREQRAER